MALAVLALTWRKWIVWPSISVVNCGWLVDRGFLRAPVEAGLEAVEHAGDERGGRAGAPAGAGGLAGEQRAGDALLEVSQAGVWNGDLERGDGGAHLMHPLAGG